jgi:hypothetical protein
MLWELWRLTRWEFGVRACLGTLGVAALLTAGPLGSYRFPLGLFLLAATALGSSLRVKSTLDDRPGFPFYLGYARPVPTWALAGIPLGYLGVAAAVGYLVPALLLRVAFGVPFPLAPVATVVAAFAVVTTSAAWWTRNRVVQVAGSALLWVPPMLVGSELGAVAMAPVMAPVAGPADMPAVGGVLSRLAALDRWPELFSFSPVLYAFVVLVVAAAFAATIVGVGRQRRADDVWAPFSESAVSAWARLAGRCRVICPTSSPTRAQVWLEMRRVGLPVLALGAAGALALPVGFALVDGYLSVGASVFGWDSRTFATREATKIVVAACAVGAPLAGLRAILGVRFTQGTAAMSVFDGTCPLGSARLASLKVAVAVACLLAAWALVGTSIWHSLVYSTEIADVDVGKRDLFAFLASTSGLRLVTLALIGVALLSAVVALVAVIQAFLVVSTRGVARLAIALLVYGAGVVLSLGMGWVGRSFIEVNVWMGTAVLVAGTIYLFRRAIVDRVLSFRETGVTALVWAACVAAALVVFRDPGQSGAAFPALLVGLLVSASVVPLTAIALTPWSLNLIRHQ